MKKIFILLTLVIFTQFSFADEKEELSKHFLLNIDKVINVVKDKTLTKDKRNSKIVDILTPMFDFTLMAKLSLGKKWKTLEKDKRKPFVDLYVERMKKSYSSKLDAYSNEKVKIVEIKQPKKNRIEIITDLVNGESKLDIVYKYYKPKKTKKDKDTWLIYDIEILGVSILKTDIAQFREYLKNKTIQDLMNDMKQN
jgi:phospholipid transport system substrate-binding protein